MKIDRIVTFLATSIAIFSLSCRSGSKSEEVATENFDTMYNQNKGNSLPYDSCKTLWDIPNFICLNIDELKKYFLTSENVTFDSVSVNKESVSKIREVALQRNDNILFVGFNVNTRVVVYYFIDAIESKSFSADGATSDVSDLLAIAGVILNADNYIVEPTTSIKNKNRYTGIKIIPRCP